MGQAPGTGEDSLRTFPRNFPGRSGTKDDKVYLCSPETATASALRGVITDPRDLAAEMEYPRIRDPEHYLTDDRSIVFPSEELRRTVVVRGPNIKPLPELGPLPDTLAAEVVLQVGDNISTDAIMPAGNQVLPFRSNIEAISEHVFEQVAPVLRLGERRGDCGGGGRSELRPGVEPRACGAGAAVPGRVRQDRKELRPHPQVQSLQLWRPAAYVQGPG